MEFPTKLAESHLESVERSEWCQKTASEDLNSYGQGYVNGVKRAIQLVEYEVASCSNLMDANTCAKALGETYPRNTILQVLMKDDNQHWAIMKEYKGKKPASIGAGEKTEKPKKTKTEPEQD